MKSVKEQFDNLSGSSAEFVIHAPGRVNLLGEHTDYNGLPVLPMALDFTVTIYGCTRPDDQVRVWSDQFHDEEAQFSLRPPLPKHERGHWCNYIKAGMQGVLSDFLQHESSVHGCDLLMTGDIPQGVGLSSSSALVVASALALLRANHREFDRTALAECMAAAEHYVGTRGGGMDQATCLLGREKHLLKIDFFPLRVKPVPLPDSVTVVICDSLVRARKTENALQGYNKRAVECRFASMLLKRFLEEHNQSSDFQRLGDLTQPPWNFTYFDIENLIQEALQEEYSFSQICEQLRNEQQIRSILEDYSFTEESEYEAMVFACGKRYRHIISDGIRVERSVECLANGDLHTFGRLMNEGQESARNHFEISCPELDELIEAARRNGALGSRLTGAGFGGCTVNLVFSNEADNFVQSMYRDYYRDKKSGMEGAVFLSKPAEGARVVKLLD